MSTFFQPARIWILLSCDDKEEVVLNKLNFQPKKREKYCELPSSDKTSFLRVSSQCGKVVRFVFYKKFYNLFIHILWWLYGIDVMTILCCARSRYMTTPKSNKNSWTVSSWRNEISISLNDVSHLVPRWFYRQPKRQVWLMKRNLDRRSRWLSCFREVLHFL